MKDQPEFTVTISGKRVVMMARFFTGEALRRRLAAAIDARLTFNQVGFEWDNIPRFNCPDGKLIYPDDVLDYNNLNVTDFVLTPMKIRKLT